MPGNGSNPVKKKTPFYPKMDKKAGFFFNPSIRVKLFVIPAASNGPRIPAASNGPRGASPRGPVALLIKVYLSVHNTAQKEIDTNHVGIQITPDFDE